MLRIKELLLTTILVLLAITVTAGYYSETQTPVYRPVLFFKQDGTSSSSGGVAMAVPFTSMAEAAAAAAAASGQGTNPSFNSPAITATPSIIPSSLMPLPSSFEVIRQWGGDYNWSTREVAFWTNLKKGEVVQFGYNSSASVSMELGYGMEQTSILWSTGSSFHGSYKTVQDGAYCFYFTIDDSVHQSEDVTVSFRCYEAVNRAAVNSSWFVDEE